jgi:hypothetical protein
MRSADSRRGSLPSISAPAIATLERHLLRARRRRRASSPGQTVPSSAVVEALEAFGVFTREGLKILAEVWGKHEFGGESDQSSVHPLDLYRESVKRLEAAGLITEHATRDHAHNLINNWQLPMYNMDFTKISARSEELREKREANVPYNW